MPSGRKPSYSPQIADRVADLVDAGLTATAIRQRLVTEGLRVPSQRTIASIVARCKPTTRDKQAKGKRSSGKGKAKKAEQSNGNGDTSAIVGILEDASGVLESIASQFDLGRADDKEIRIYNQTLRTLSQVATQVQRLTPPEPPDPNAHPDMRAASDKGMAKLWDYLERALAGKFRRRAKARRNG
jgi:hypothetical protein